MNWDCSEIYSVKLGHPNAPLFKFCYEYIILQKIDITKIPVAQEAFRSKQLYDKNKTANDSDLQILFEYYKYYEENILGAIERITKRLEKPDDISFYDYGKIAVYLIVIKDILGCDIDLAKKRLISNLAGRGGKLQSDYIFRTTLGECSKSAHAEYEELYEQMIYALKKDTEGIPDFDYLPKQAEHFYTYVSNHNELFYMRGRFASDLNIKKLAEMFALSTPWQKNDIRKAILSVYRTANVKQFIVDDYSSIDALLTMIKKDSESATDKIQKKQYQWFIDNLTEILSKLK